ALSQRSPRNELQHEVMLVSGLPPGMDLDDVGMPHGGHELGFPLQGRERREALLLLTDALERLQRHLPAQVQVVSLPDRDKSPLPQRASDADLAGDGVG